MTSQPETAPGPALLRRTLTRHRRLMLPGMAIMCLWQACEAAVPVLIGLVVDHAVVPLDRPALVIGLVAVAVLFTVLSLGYRFGARLANRALNLETHALRVEVAGRALDPRGVRTGLMPGEVLSVATADADVTSFIIRRIALMGSAVVGVVAGGIYLFVTDWVIGLVVLGGVAITLGLSHLVSRPIERHTRTMQAKIAAASGQATDLMRGLRVIKGIGAEPAVRQQYQRANHDARDASVRTASGMAVADGAQQTILGLLIAAVVLVGGYRLLDGHLTVGGLIAVVGLAVFLAEPISTVVASIPLLFYSVASARRIGDFLAQPDLIRSGQSGLTTETATLTVTGLTGPDGQTLDLTVRPGELLALVVHDPSMSEAITSALAGESAQSDTVALDGVPRTELSLEAVRDRLAVAPHKVDVFEGTLRSNVVLRHRSVEQERLAPALEASACAELLELFPDGLDHAVAADGANLSGGQRQRIALARALVADPEVLVLCDPTTAVDAVTEQQIATSLAQVRRGRTTIVVTSSPALCAGADRVVLVGRSTQADGTHAELLARSDDYRELVLR